MMPAGSASPTSTRQYRIGFFSPVSSSISSTRPTTSGPSTVDPSATMPSTSRPTRTNAFSSRSASRSGRSTYSRSHETETFTAIPFRPLDRGLRFAAPCWRPMSSAVDAERAGEPHVAFHHVAHVGGVVAEHQRPLDAHAERETAVLVRVHAAGAQHARVDHAAPAPLDPPRTALRLREPQDRKSVV